jgi:glyoxylase-like metal-dependent hydrolase (beta-lactamase superfamily II)
MVSPKLYAPIAMPSISRRNPETAPGDWYIDTSCIDCGASCSVAPGLVVERNGYSVFERQPRTREEETAAWRAALVCPTASIGRVSGGSPPAGLYPHELAPGVFRCGYNARSSFGAHAYFVARASGNLLIDSPRFNSRLVSHFEAAGGVASILLTHRDDVADAGRYAERFGARVVIHADDADAAPYATDRMQSAEPASLADGLLAIPVAGHTKGSTVYLLDETYLFTGDSLAWDDEESDLVAFRDACWYSWEEQTRSLGRLAAHSFSWVLAGHGGSVQLPAEEMHDRLLALVERMSRQ